jgi:hypothetical protein
MRRRRNRVGFEVALLAAIACGASFAADAPGAPVTGWQYVDGPPINCIPCQGFDTNHPRVGDGTPDSADNVGIYASTSTNNQVDVGQEAILSGRVRITGGAMAAREFRFGLWDKVDNGVMNPIHGWLGYMAQNASGNTTGRLEARNPDDPNFNSVSFLSDLGGGSLAANSGPAPATGSPLANPPTSGNGTGRYFLLADGTADDNASWADSRWYNFEVRVSRIGPGESLVRASLIADPVKPTGDFNDDGTVNAADYTVWRNQLGESIALANEGGVTPGIVTPEDFDSWKNEFGNESTVPYRWQVEELDVNGNPPPLVVDGVPNTYTPHLTFDFDRVGFLLGGGLNADLGEFQDIDVSVRDIQTLQLSSSSLASGSALPEPGTLALLLAGGLVGRWPRRRTLSPGAAGRAGRDLP